MLCPGRFPRPDELLDNNFQIETNRSYERVDNSYNKELIPTPLFKNLNCISKNCFMHLDYEFNIEKELWESKMVRVHYNRGTQSNGFSRKIADLGMKLTRKSKLQGDI